MRSGLFALAALSLASPAAAQDGSGVERERTKATAQEFFGKATERSKSPIKVDAKAPSGDEDFGYNGTFKFPSGQVLAITAGKAECVTEVKATYAAFASNGGQRPGNPIVGAFQSNTQNQFQIGTAFIYWADVTSVVHSGETLIVRGPWHIRFIFPSEELAQRFGQAMEFMRTQCNANTDDDLAF